MALDPEKIRLQELAHKYLKGTLSPSEQVEFDEWFKNEGIAPIEVKENIAVSEEEHRQLILARINEEIQINQNHQIKKLWPRIAAAASILLFLSVGGYFLFHKSQPTNQLALAKPLSVKPGANRAILTLSNGQTIALNSAANGQLAKQNNTIINKTADGKLVYAVGNQQGNIATTQVQYNTIATLRGGEWPEISLPDGTKVKLDAVSSIRYPVQFIGNERVVEVTGQAYFKVKQDKSRPFKLIFRGQSVNDLGTEFNINAYDDEPVVRVTLVEGSVKVVKNDRSAILVPGQQAVTLNADNSITVKSVDVDDVIAWKNGKTSFKNEEISEIMRQASRWYDIDVEYEGKIPDRRFVGGIDRYSSFSDFLKILDFNNVHFTVSGKKIIIKP